jgi:hypothetical protein
MQNLERAYADDIRIRLADEKNPIEGVAIAKGHYLHSVILIDDTVFCILGRSSVPTLNDPVAIRD